METETQISQGQERRRNMKLRGIYPDARIRIDHFFHTDAAWAGSPKDYLALRVIHEAYPELTSDEVRLLMAAIERKVLQDRAQSSA
jgi:lipase chaperone LimK